MRFLFFFLVFLLFYACTIHQHCIFNRDGSGSYTMTIDLRQMLAQFEGSDTLDIEEFSEQIEGFYPDNSSKITNIKTAQVEDGVYFL